MFPVAMKQLHQVLTPLQLQRCHMSGHYIGGQVLLTRSGPGLPPDSDWG